MDISNIYVESNKYINRLNALTIIEIGNKVGITDDNSLYVEYFKNGKIQAWYRSITGQSRIRVNNYLKIQFKNYVDFLIYLLVINSENKNCNTISSLVIKHNLFLKKIIIGLSNLKVSYPDYQEILDTCDTYIDEFDKYIKICDN